MTVENRKQLAVLGVIILIALGGCLNMTIEVDVNADGTIDEMDVTMEMDEMVYNALEEEAAEEGYADVESYLTDDELDSDEDGWGAVSYNEQHEDDEVIISMTAEDGDPDELDDIDISVDDDEITFLDRDGFEEMDDGDDEFDDFMGQITFEYIVNMPGEVTDTNGELGDDNTTVRWTMTQHENEEQFEATSQRDDDDGLPGFGFVAALIALLASLSGYQLVRN